jgi:GT2 family glycosyltransferase
MCTGRADIRISVVIAAYNSEYYLSRCLESLAKSDVSPLECIVVDDCSTDGTAEVAANHGARVIGAGANRGPAYARNLGAAAASGDIVLFLDSDVCVHPDTLAMVAARFESEPELDALFGSYDDAPEAPGIVSQFRNLLHCFVHQTSSPRAWTFWSGCGAIRRPVFLEHDGFDISYRRPSIEDIEFGYRLTGAGHSIMLDRTIQVTHLKPWSLPRMLETDIFSRGVPWTRLILAHGTIPADLNLRWRHRLSAALPWPLFVLSLLALQRLPQGALNDNIDYMVLWALAGTLAGFLALNWRLLAFLTAKRGWFFAACSVPLTVLHYACCSVAFAIGAGEHANTMLTARQQRLGRTGGAIHD